MNMMKTSRKRLRMPFMIDSFAALLMNWIKVGFVPPVKARSPCIWSCTKATSCAI